MSNFMLSKIVTEALGDWIPTDPAEFYDFLIKILKGLGIGGQGSETEMLDAWRSAQNIKLPDTPGQRAPIVTSSSLDPLGIMGAVTTAAGLILSAKDIVEEGPSKAILQMLRERSNLRLLPSFPDAGSIIRAALQTEITGDDISGLRLQGYGSWAQERIKAALKTRLSPREYWLMHQRGELLTGRTVEKCLEQAGMFSDDTEAFLKLQESLLPLDGVISLWHWGALSDSKATEYLKRLGYRESSAVECLEASMKPIPRSDLDRLLYMGKIDIATYAHHLNASQLSGVAVDTLVEWPYQPTPGNTAVQMFLNGIIDETGLITRIKATGLSDAESRHVAKSIYKPLDTDALIQLYRRGHLEYAQLANELKRNGIRASDATEIERLAWLTPGASDVVRFAVREVWTPEIVAKYNYDDDFPTKSVLWARRAGLTEEILRMFWRAHWELPGPSQAAEMVWRIDAGQDAKPRKDRATVLSETEFKEFLQTADYPKFWRERFAKMLYSPITRVDIRRVFNYGYCTIEDVYNNYRSGGYDHDNAEKLTQWTVEEYLPRPLAMARDAILDAYTDGALSPAEALASLRSLVVGDKQALPDTSIDLYLKQADITIAKKARDIALTVIKKEYIDKLVDKVEVNDRLTMLGITQTEKERALYAWDWELDYEEVKKKPRKAAPKQAGKKPSEADFARWLKGGYITPEQFKQEMSALGYSDGHIEIYMQEIADSLTTQGKSQ